MSETTTNQAILNVTDSETLNEQLQAKAEELSKQNGGVRVKALHYICPIKGDAIIGFLKEPNRTTAVNLIGKIMENSVIGGSLALQSCIMKEVSDSRILDESPAYNSIYYGACMDAADLFTVAINQFKKK